MTGSYGVFIWSAYGATAIAIAALVVRAVIDHRMQLRALARLEGAGPDRPGSVPHG